MPKQSKRQQAVEDLEQALVLQELMSSPEDEDFDVVDTRLCIPSDNDDLLAFVCERRLLNVWIWTQNWGFQSCAEFKILN